MKKDKEKKKEICNCKKENCIICGRKLLNCRLDRYKTCAVCAFFLNMEGEYPPKLNLKKKDLIKPIKNEKRK